MPPQFNVYNHSFFHSSPNAVVVPNLTHGGTAETPHPRISLLRRVRNFLDVFQIEKKFQKKIYF